MNQCHLQSAVSQASQAFDSRFPLGWESHWMVLEKMSSGSNSRDSSSNERKSLISTVSAVEAREADSEGE
jgi:hypothetical protein